jgi:hypothetical protein
VVFVVVMAAVFALLILLALKVGVVTGR